MPFKVGTPTGASSVSATPTSSKKQLTELAFPANLLHPPQSQLVRSEDAVSDRIVKLDAWANRLGEGFGISYTSFVLNPVPSVDDSSSGIVILTAVLATFGQRAERVSLERRGGRWGLYFTRDPAALAQDRKSDTIPLKDAPLDVRDRFLVKSEEFFREYLQLCEDRLGRMKDSVGSADRTLKLLENIQLK